MSPESSPPPADSPPERLARTFRAIGAERMQGVPLLNPGLAVEAVGFRPWNGHWIGVLVTPWMIGLYLLPGEPGSWPRIASGGRCTWALPAGDYVFLVDEEEGIGPFHVLTLLSPVKQFADQAAAVAASREVLEQVLKPAEGAPGRAGTARPAEQQTLNDPQLEELFAEKGVTRRDLLRRFGER